MTHTLDYIKEVVNEVVNDLYGDYSYELHGIEFWNVVEGVVAEKKKELANQPTDIFEVGDVVCWQTTGSNDPGCAIKTKEGWVDPNASGSDFDMMTWDELLIQLKEETISMKLPKLWYASEWRRHPEQADG